MALPQPAFGKNYLDMEKTLTNALHYILED